MPWWSTASTPATEVAPAAFEGGDAPVRDRALDADWQIVRADGAAMLEARYCVRTAEGALVFIENEDLRTGPPDVLARLARGEHVAPDEYYFRTTPRFETAAPRYAWLSSVVAVGSAVRAPGSVILDFYVVS